MNVRVIKTKHHEDIGDQTPKCLRRSRGEKRNADTQVGRQDATEKLKRKPRAVWVR